MLLEGGSDLHDDVDKLVSLADSVRRTATGAPEHGCCFSRHELRPALEGRTIKLDAIQFRAVNGFRQDVNLFPSASGASLRRLHEAGGRSHQAPNALRG